jgi:hapalindole-type alkaloid chlorinase
VNAVATLRCVEIEVGELADHPDALHDIYTRKLDVIVIRGALPEHAASRVVNAIEDNFDRLHWTPQEYPDLRPGQMLVMGMTLTPVSGLDLDLDRYHQLAARFRDDVRRLFAGDPDFETTLSSTLSALSGARPVRLPARDGERCYTPATIRKLPPGCSIPVHCGNFFLQTPGYRRLSRLVDLEDQLSYFYTLRAADSGGELEIYELEWRDPATPMLSDTVYDGPRIAREHSGVKLRPAAGDLLLFDGGRYYHRVTCVGGEASRWTLGGFVGFSKDKSEVLVWS